MNATEQPPTPGSLGPDSLGPHSSGFDSPEPDAGAADRLARAVDRLVRQIAHWQPGRWSMPAGAAPAGLPGAPGAGGSSENRADRVYALVQRLADRGADAERRPCLPVPRLGDPVLPDQLRVLANDLLMAGVPIDVVRAAADDVDAVRRTL